MDKLYKLIFGKKNIYKLLLSLIVIVIYLPWFDFFKSLSAGDWPYLYRENIVDFRWFPNAPFIWLEPYYNLTSKIGSQLFNLPWEVTEKLFWFYPFLFTYAISSWVFLRLVFNRLGVKRHLDFFIFLGCVIFTLNTYALMIVGGGQMGVAMAYALAPLVLYSYLRVLENKIGGIKNLLIFSIASSFQLMFDPRIFVITLSLYVLHFFVVMFIEKRTSPKILRNLLFMNVFSVILNLFWILPNFLHFGDFIKAAREADATFLSFASFSNSISLLHPNWPENIFGKIGFMKSEYIFIPIISFIGLFSTALKDKKYKASVLFFSLAALLGAFFSKGTNDPFGSLYLFLSNLPGGSLFRDSTKFYLWICLSYSILFPLGIYYLLDRFFKNKKKIGKLFLIAVVLYLIFLIKPAVYGNLTGTFSPHSVPKDYINLKNFLVSQKEETAILWFPRKQRFGFSSSISPAVNADEIIESAWNRPLLNSFIKMETKEILEEYDIKYVVVPYDAQGELFLTDRKYDENIYKTTIDELRKTPYLLKIVDNKGENRFGKIMVFEVVKH